ncbi:MAG: GNAT family N-acetyltransferase [Bacteroidota bacterium]
MKIKTATIKEAIAISKLIASSTRYNPNQYSAAQQRVWINYNSPEKIIKFLLNRTIFCAIHNENLVGTIALKHNEILGFYVNPQFRNRGIGSALLAHLEAEAIKRGIGRLHLSSTPSAEIFYQKKGFLPIKEIVVTIDGVDFPEMEMEKFLDPKSI